MPPPPPPLPLWLPLSASDGLFPCSSSFFARALISSMSAFSDAVTVISTPLSVSLMSVFALATPLGQFDILPPFLSSGAAEVAAEAEAEGLADAGFAADELALALPEPAPAPASGPQAKANNDSRTAALFISVPCGPTSAKARGDQLLSLFAILGRGRCERELSILVND